MEAVFNVMSLVNKDCSIISRYRDILKIVRKDRGDTRI